VTYNFSVPEYTKINAITGGVSQSGYFNKRYATSWYLSEIISPFKNDTIKFNYTSFESNYTFQFPETGFLNSSGNLTIPSTTGGNVDQTIQRISSIDLPDKTHINFVYSFDKKNTPTSNALSKIKISDTSFRFGYLLDYDTTYLRTGTNRLNVPIPTDCKLHLTSLTPFTPSEKKDGYKFGYYGPLMPLTGSYGDTLQNKRDHWGFYNAANNGVKIIPSVAGYAGGANRESNSNSIASALSTIILPDGGKIVYEYAPNDRYPYVNNAHHLYTYPNGSSQNIISLQQVYNSKHQISFSIDRSISRSNPVPISGSGNLECVIKSADGTTTLASRTFSLYNLFYDGLYQWKFNLPNGEYVLETMVSSGTTLTSDLIVNLDWENKVESSLNLIETGGLRVRSIKKFSDSTDRNVSVQLFKYVLENGKSSGFLGEAPSYSYPFRKIHNAVITDYTAISSEPVSAIEMIQGGVVGYSRVEVSNDWLHPLGKTVYEFTDLRDVNAEVHSPTFPFEPQMVRAWGLGLPKKVSIYDSVNRLVKRTTNSYLLDTVKYTSNFFRSVKLGHSETRSGLSIPTRKTFIAQEFSLNRYFRQLIR